MTLRTEKIKELLSDLSTRHHIALLLGETCEKIKLLLWQFKVVQKYRKRRSEMPPNETRMIFENIRDEENQVLL
jgi:hypothetical protein